MSSPEAGRRAWLRCGGGRARAAREGLGLLSYQQRGAVRGFDPPFLIGCTRRSRISDCQLLVGGGGGGAGMCARTAHSCLPSFIKMNKGSSSITVPVTQNIVPTPESSLYPPPCCLSTRAVH